MNSYIIIKQEMIKIYAENQSYSQIQAPDWFNRLSTLVLLDIQAARQQRHLHFLVWNYLFLAKKIHLLINQKFSMSNIILTNLKWIQKNKK